MTTLQFREAKAEDAATILDIVNGAYRTQGGWTTESHLVVGDRLVEFDFLNDVTQHNKRMFVASTDEREVGCIQISVEGAHVSFSLFAVLPREQGKGYGSQILQYAEKRAKEEYAAAEVVMSVLDVRHELLDFYYRRGYQPANEYLPYPLGLNVGKPINQNLMLEKIAKSL